MKEKIIASALKNNSKRYKGKYWDHLKYKDKPVENKITQEEIDRAKKEYYKKDNQ